MAGALKQSTLITGLNVVANPTVVLKRIYNLTLEILEKMPEKSAYRRYTKDLIHHKLAIINSTADVKVLEEKINCGQIEEVINQAKRELTLARNFLWMKPWESLTTPAPPGQWQWPLK